MGYGARALQSLSAYYSGDIMNIEETQRDENWETFEQAAAVGKVGDELVPCKHISATYESYIMQSTSLLEDSLTHRSVSSLPPLLQKLSQRRPEALDYLGVSYGLTQPLLKFWKRAGYAPYYVRQTENDLTGECTCVMLKPLAADSTTGFEAFAVGM